MAKDYGWQIETEEAKHNWPVLRENVQNYIKGTNYGYVRSMAEIGVDYVNAKTEFSTTNSVEF